MRVTDATTYKRAKVDRWIGLWILLTLSVVLRDLLQEESARYSVLVYTMYVTPFIYLFRMVRIGVTELLLFAMLIVMYLDASLLHPNFFRPSTFFYSCMFVFTFLLYRSIVIRGAISVNDVARFVRYVLYAYFVVLVLQQFQVLIGEQPWNAPVYTENRWKLNSLSMEPSNTILVTAVLIFTHVKLQEMMRGERKYRLSHVIHADKWVWMAYLYVNLTCGSMTVLFVLPVLACYFFNRRSLRYLPAVVIVLVLAVNLLAQANPQLMDRFTDLLTVLFNTKEATSQMVSEVDPSSAVRFVPYMEFFRTFDITSINTWFGHGIDQLEVLCTNVVVDDVERAIGANNILSLFYDYGLIPGVLFFVFLARSILPRLISFQTVYYLLVFTVLPLNHYITWLMVCLFFTINHFRNNYDKTATHTPRTDRRQYTACAAGTTPWTTD